MVLQALRVLGVRIAVDDFGTGHSSLGRIWELPVDELKLDRSFVSRMCDDPRPTAIVHAGVQLAEAFSFTVGGVAGRTGRHVTKASTSCRVLDA